MKNLTSLLCGLFALFFNVSFGQTYWQQAVKYKMNVEMDVETFQYSGDQELVYTNNSPDVLKRVFYHLYFNAFQPGSEMSVRVKTGKDKNTRFKIEIDSLKTDEEGFLLVSNLKQDGVLLKSKMSEPILKSIWQIRYCQEKARF